MVKKNFHRFGGIAAFFFLFFCSSINSVNLNKGFDPESLIAYTGDSLMNTCDTNPKNGEISMKELRVCFDDMVKKKFAVKESSPEEFMKDYDTDRNKKIEKKEFVDVLLSAMKDKMDKEKSVDDDDDDEDEVKTKKRGSQKIKLTRRDGSVEYVTQDELMQLNQKNLASNPIYQGNQQGGGETSPLGQGEFQQDEEGRYRQQNAGKKTLAEIADSDPQLGRFIKLGQWVATTISIQLERNGKGSIVNASDHIVQLRSLPTGGSPNRGEDKVEDIVLGDEFEVWMEMSLNNGSKQINLEAHVQRSESFSPPYSIQVLDAWFLNLKGSRVRSINMTGAKVLHTQDPTPKKLKSLLMSDWMQTHYSRLLKTFKEWQQSGKLVILQAVCLGVVCSCAVILIALTKYQKLKRGIDSINVRKQD